MSRVTAHQTKLDCHENGDLVSIHPASAKSIHAVLDSDIEDENGRSQWVWVRFPNGDLVLGIFPQGDTYFSVEEDAAAYPGPYIDTIWCEQCGERPTVVNTDHAGLCARCAAHEIDNPDREFVNRIQSIRNRLAVTGDYADTIRAAHAMLGNLIGEQNPIQPFEHWGNDPDHPVEDWRAEVASDETRLSYAEWLSVKQEG